MVSHVTPQPLTFCQRDACRALHATDEEVEMKEVEQIRAILFRDGNHWVAQCLEYDIGAQASDLDDLHWRLRVAIKVELNLSLSRNGADFAGIPSAPRQFHEMWERRSGTFTPKNGDSERVRLDMGIAA